MAGELTIVAASVRAIDKPDFPARIISLPAGEAITAGQWCRIDTSTGQATKGNASGAAEARPGGIALKTAAAVGDTVEIIVEGLVSLGNALSGAAYDADIYLSDTDGRIATAAGSTAYIVGRVFPVFGNGSTPDKVLQLYGKGN